MANKLLLSFDVTSIGHDSPSPSRGMHAKCHKNALFVLRGIGVSFPIISCRESCLEKLCAAEV